GRVCGPGSCCSGAGKFCCCFCSRSSSCVSISFDFISRDAAPAAVPFEGAGSNSSAAGAAAAAGFAAAAGPLTCCCAALRPRGPPQGAPQQNVDVWSCCFGAGHGLSLFLSRICCCCCRATRAAAAALPLPAARSKSCCCAAPRPPQQNPPLGERTGWSCAAPRPHHRHEGFRFWGCGAGAYGAEHAE
ncbi:hypothetical protein ETH_00042805, partial [Eimeria tenella]